MPPTDGELRENANPERVDGARDGARALLSALRERSLGLRCCFEPWVDATTDDEGRLVVAVSIQSDGTISDVVVDGARSTVSEARTLACLKTNLRGSKLSTTSSELTLVEYPLRVRRPR